MWIPFARNDIDADVISTEMPLSTRCVAMILSVESIAFTVTKLGLSLHAGSNSRLRRVAGLYLRPAYMGASRAAIGSALNLYS